VRELPGDDVSEYKSPVTGVLALVNVAGTSFGAPSLNKTIILRLDRLMTGTPLISLRARRMPSAEAVLPDTV
jgi:hypothetical protein